MAEVEPEEEGIDEEAEVEPLEEEELTLLTEVGKAVGDPVCLGVAAPSFPRDSGVCRCAGQTREDDEPF